MNKIGVFIIMTLLRVGALHSTPESLSPEESLTPLNKPKVQTYFNNPESEVCETEDLLKAQLLEKIHRGDIPMDFPWPLLIALYPEGKTIAESSLQKFRENLETRVMSPSNESKDTQQDKKNSQKIETPQDLDKLLKKRFKDRIAGAMSEYAYHQVHELTHNIPRFETRLEIIKNFFAIRGKDFTQYPLTKEELAQLQEKILAQEKSNSEAYKREQESINRKFSNPQPHIFETGLTVEDYQILEDRLQQKIKLMNSLTSSLPGLIRSPVNYKITEDAIKGVQKQIQMEQDTLRKLREKGPDVYTNFRKTTVARKYGVYKPFSLAQLTKIAISPLPMQLHFLERMIFGQSSLHETANVHTSIAPFRQSLKDTISRNLNAIVAQAPQATSRITDWLPQAHGAVLNIDEQVLSYREEYMTPKQIEADIQRRRAVLELIEKGYRPGTLEFEQAFKKEYGQSMYAQIKWVDLFKSSRLILKNSFLLMAQNSNIRRVGYLGLGIFAEVGRQVYDEKSLKSFLTESCGLESQTVDRISDAVFTSSVYKSLPFMRVSPKHCADLVIDVEKIFEFYKTEIETPGTIQGGTCALLKMQTQRWEKLYFKDDISLKPQDEKKPCQEVELRAADTAIGTFTLHHNRPVLKLPATKEHLGLFLPLVFSQGSWKFDPETLLCFTQDSQGTPQIRSSFCDVIKNHYKAMASPGIGQPVVPELSKEAFYRRGEKSLDVLNNEYATGALRNLFRYPMAMRQGVALFEKLGCLSTQATEKSPVSTSTNQAKPL